MTISSQDLNDLAFIAHELAQPDFRPILRRKRLSERLLSLFRAEFLGQTQWNAETSVFEKPICYNRDQSMSWAYETYFQFRDPLSQHIRNRTQPTPTYEIIPRTQLERSEYFADFLRPFKVSHGIDQYLFDDGKNIGDLRIWRRSAEREFTSREKKLLGALSPMLKNAYVTMLSGDQLEQAVSCAEFMAIAISADHKKFVFSPALTQWISQQPAFAEQHLRNTVMSVLHRGRTTASFSRFRLKITWRNVASKSQCAILCRIIPSTFGDISTPLTSRERQVGMLIARGLTDRDISEELNISYWTVRTHVGNAMRKLKARNRVELANRASVGGWHA